MLGTLQNTAHNPKNNGCPLFFYALVQIPPFYFQNKKNVFVSFRMDLNSCATSRREACMESMQSIVWNPLQDGMESSRRKCTFGDAMRLRRYHTR